MSTDFRTVPVQIPNGKGRKSIEGVAVFNSGVIRAGVALNGFRLDDSSGDMHLNIVEADTDLLAINGNAVKFHVECLLADKSHDDDYSGYITALVIAEVV